MFTSLIGMASAAAANNAAFGHASVVQLLLEAGADQTHTTTNGLTALELAKRDRHTQVIRVLEANQTIWPHHTRSF
ncbi:MAG: hypothetical protein ACFB0D_02135 [Phormidesmis sp.]